MSETRLDEATAVRHGVCPECEGYQDGPCDDADCLGCALDSCPGCGGSGAWADYAKRLAEDALRHILPSFDGRRLERVARALLAVSAAPQAPGDET